MLMNLYSNSYSISLHVPWVSMLDESLEISFTWARRLSCLSFVLGKLASSFIICFNNASIFFTSVQVCEEVVSHLTICLCVLVHTFESHVGKDYQVDCSEGCVVKQRLEDALSVWLDAKRSYVVFRSSQLPHRSFTMYHMFSSCDCSSCQQNRKISRSWGYLLPYMFKSLKSMR